jgi:hypothetical protein
LKRGQTDSLSPFFCMRTPNPGEGCERLSVWLGEISMR